MGIGAITGVVVARILGPQARGTYAIAIAAPTFIGTAGTFGIEEALVFLAGRAADANSRRRLLAGGLTLALLFGSTASVAAAGLQVIVFLPRERHISNFLFLSFSILPLVYSLTQVSIAYLRASGRYALWNTIRLAVVVTYAAGIAGSILVTGRLTADDAVASLEVANLLVVVWALIAIRTDWTIGVPRYEMKMIASYGWKNHLITVQTIANQQLDQVLLAALLPAVQVGYYAIAVTYSSAGMTLGLAPAQQIYSHFSRRGSADKAAFDRLLRRILLILVGTACVTGPTAPFLIERLFGHGYKGAVVPAIILVAAAPLLAADAMYSAVWKSAGQPLKAAKCEGAGLVVTIIALPVGIHEFGIDGAAAVSIISYGLVVLLLHNGRPFEKLLHSQTDVGQSYLS